MTIDVDETWTVRRLSTRYCDGYSLSAGYPPRMLQQESAVSDELIDGEVVRILSEPMGSSGQKCEKRKDKKKKRKEAKKYDVNENLIDESLTFCSSIQGIEIEEPYPDDDYLKQEEGGNVLRLL